MALDGTVVIISYALSPVGVFQQKPCDGHQFYYAANCIRISDCNLNSALHAGSGMPNLQKSACNDRAVLCESVRASGRYCPKTQARLERRYGLLTAGSYQYVTGSR